MWQRPIKRYQDLVVSRHLNKKGNVSLDKISNLIKSEQFLPKEMNGIWLISIARFDNDINIDLYKMRSSPGSEICRGVLRWTWTKSEWRPRESFAGEVVAVH